LAADSDSNKLGVEKCSKGSNERMKVQWLKSINRERGSEEQD